VRSTQSNRFFGVIPYLRSMESQNADFSKNRHPARVIGASFFLLISVEKYRGSGLNYVKKEIV
ncbi:hypothetical protein, partial [Klebsiella pneumoniae]